MARYLLRAIPPIILLTMMAAAYLLVVRLGELPFRSLNDELHRSGSPLTLDLLIPAGVHIDEKMTVKEVARIRLKAEGGFLERSLTRVSEIIPARYRVGADVFLFLFWSFLFMIFFRVFTFLGYGRSIRMSLFLGSVTYYFMPDFSPGHGDDILFLAFAFLVILFNYMLKKRNGTREKR